MIIADIVEYKPQKTDVQGNTESCTAHAALGCIRELVEQNYNVDIDFDIIKIFNEFEATRASFQDRIVWFLKMMRKGVRTKDNSFVKITGSTAPEQTVNGICGAVQAYGPVIVSIITKENNRHALQIIGFDRIKKIYKLQDSLNLNNNIKNISFEALHGVMISAYSILGVKYFPKIK